MKYLVLFIALFLSTFAVYGAESTEDGETCRSYVIDHSINKKYCLRDLDDKIAEYDRKNNPEKYRQWLDDLQKDDPTLFPKNSSEQPKK